MGWLKKASSYLNEKVYIVHAVVTKKKKKEENPEALLYQHSLTTTLANPI